MRWHSRRPAFCSRVEPAGESLTDLLRRKHVLGANVPPDHEPRIHRKVEGVHQIGQRALLGCGVVSQRGHGAIPSGQVGLDRGVHRHRDCPTAGVDQRCVGVEVRVSRRQGQSEPGSERQHLGMIGVDELGAALARLTVAEVMAEHSPTDTIASLQHDHVDASLHQHVGASQTSEPTADDRHVDLSTVRAHSSSQNSVGCSAMMRRGTPGHGT